MPTPNVRKVIDDDDDETYSLPLSGMTSQGYGGESIDQLIQGADDFPEGGYAPDDPRVLRKLFRIRLPEEEDL